MNIKKFIYCGLTAVVVCVLSACSGSGSGSGSDTDSSVSDSGSMTLNPPGSDDRICTPSPRLQWAGTKPFIGNIYRPEVKNDERFHQLWNQLTPENASKWISIEGVRNEMNWALTDDAVAFAANFNYGFKFHSLIAQSNTPTWMADLTMNEQTQEIEQWFNEIATRYPDLQQIDVVSDPISKPPSYIEALGGTGDSGWDWVIRAFELARITFPGSELLLNDYNVTSSNQTSTEFLTLVGLLQQRELIDGIGVDGHFLEDSNADTIQSKLDKLTAFSLPVYLADFDINIADDERQLQIMKTLFPIFYEHETMSGITFWGYRENQLWQADAYLINRLGVNRPALDWLACYVGLDS